MKTRICTLNQVDQMEDVDIASLFKQSEKQEPAKASDSDPSISTAANIPAPDVDNSSRPTPKKRFKAANQESVEDLLSHNREISTKHTKIWTVSALKGMFHSFVLLGSCLLQYISGYSNIDLWNIAAQFVHTTVYKMK